MGRPIRMVLTLCAASLLFACSGWTESDECATGDTAPCDTQCGPGTMTCTDSVWGSCEIDGTVECLPGDFGQCEIMPSQPPGLWLCSDTCHRGPCQPLCMPGETFECEAECGMGQSYCQDDGTWGPCREYIIPECRPGDVDRCTDDRGHRRCSETCDYGDCDGGAPCTPGEVSFCGSCASQTCQDDGTWTECEADAWAVCAPGEREACEAPCGPGERTCSDNCTWSDCWEVDPVLCHPGDRQLCPTTLYCGLAYRVCTMSCHWTDCLETGD